MNELTVKTNKLELPEIVWNQEEVEKAVGVLVKKYKGLQFTEEQAKEAAEDLAAIRKVRKNLNDEKIKVNKEWNIPYTKFENAVKVSLKDIDNIIANVDKQVKEFKENQKTARKAQIQFYKEWIDVAAYITFDESWLLKKWESKDDVKIKEHLKDLRRSDQHGKGTGRNWQHLTYRRRTMYMELE